MLNAHSITRMHDESTAQWHRGVDWELPEPGTHLSQLRSLLDTPDQREVLALAVAQHRANYDLWHREDEARSPDAADRTIAEVKHAIDALNQRRNDLVEQMDAMLIQHAGEQNMTAPLHSETPGLIIDRLSILALKLYHTAEEAHRETATEAHRARNLARLAVLREQRDDLAGCLGTLWAEVLTGRRRFRLYRQMKMYNDPELNPILYGRPH